MFLNVVEEDEAVGEVAEIYQRERDAKGFVMEATRALTTRPEILGAWGRFVSTVREGFSLSTRDWQLITLIAARHIPSTYCSLVYGSALVDDLGSIERVVAFQQDFRNAGLAPRDVAMLEYAENITLNASRVTEEDIERLRGHGFSDQQIFDIALCASLRNFISRLFDAVGAMPDEPYQALDATLREPLTVGRSTTTREKTATRRTM